MKNKFRSKKSFILLISLAFVLLVGVSGTIAYLVATSGPVVNIFTSSGVPITVTDDVENNIKKNLVITNDGNVSAYIRVAIVGNWVKDGSIVAPWDMTQGIFTGLPDPDADINSNSNWVKYGSYYYYTEPVAPRATITDQLFTQYTAPDEVPVDGAHLEMTILAQAVQSDGYAADGTTKAVIEAWGVDPANLN